MFGILLLDHYMHIDDLNEEQKVVITTYFYHEDIVNKLQSVIEKKVNQVDGSGRSLLRSIYGKKRLIK